MTTEAQKAYQDFINARENLVGSTVKEILERIKGKQEIDVYDLGFEATSSCLFEGSWQERVTDILSDKGFLCSMLFDYDGYGKLTPSLNVKRKMSNYH